MLLDHKLVASGVCMSNGNLGEASGIMAIYTAVWLLLEKYSDVSLDLVLGTGYHSVLLFIYNTVDSIAGSLFI